MNFLLDTHILLWWTIGVPKLSQAQKRALDAIDKGQGKAHLSIMTIWEIATLHALGRIQVDFDLQRWLRELFLHDRIQIVPLDLETILESAKLRETLPGDPVDQMIVATAKVHGLTLLSADENIQKNSGISVI
jgi:PIN domain nuclease of toxin-antitoxin system